VACGDQVLFFLEKRLLNLRLPLVFNKRSLFDSLLA
jgi:hypothetical protein